MEILFIGVGNMHKNDCTFCQIVKKELNAWIIWESDKHLAFLSIYPNMKGVTVVVPKKHEPSYVFEIKDQEFIQLMLAAKQVAKLLDKKLEGVGRTALVLEGFGVDHAHAKLYPLPNTAHLVDNWQQVKSDHKVYFENYLGYVCSNDYYKASDIELEALSKLIKEQ